MTPRTKAIPERLTRTRIIFKAIITFSSGVLRSKNTVAPQKTSPYTRYIQKFGDSHSESYRSLYTGRYPYSSDYNNCNPCLDRVDSNPVLSSWFFPPSREKPYPKHSKKARCYFQSISRRASSVKSFPITKIGSI